VHTIHQRTTDPPSLRQCLERRDLDAVRTGHEGGKAYSPTFELGNKARKLCRIDVLAGESDLRLRYLIIDTGGWLSGRKVLLSTAWLSSVEPTKKMVVVNIEKKRIKESPPYEPGTPVDREYETRLHDYYGFPYYWQV
jgi:hypothetical protein